MHPHIPDINTIDVIVVGVSSAVALPTVVAIPAIVLYFFLDVLTPGGSAPGLTSDF